MVSQSPENGRLYAATGDGIARLDEAGGEWSVELSLSGSGAQCLAVDPGNPERVYAGLRGGGVRRTDDAGRTWVECSLPQSGVFSVAVSPVDGAVYAGTEPSALFVSQDAGRTWRELEALLDLASRPTWSFPPRPWTSHVRWIAPSPHDADLVLVGIELGGLMRSTDGGGTWHDHAPGAARDVHSLAWHPGVEGRGYEAGGDGAAWSEDAGETWRPANEGRDRHYTWSVTVDPADPDLWYVSASTGAYAMAVRTPRLESTGARTAAGGRSAAGCPSPYQRCPTPSWQRMRASLPGSRTASFGRAVIVARRGALATSRAGSSPGSMRWPTGAADRGPVRADARPQEPPRARDETSEVLGAAATLYGVGGALSILLQARHMRARGASCDVLARLLATYVGGYAIWLVYGVSLGSVPILLVHTDGLISGAVTLAVALSLRGSL